MTAPARTRQDLAREAVTYSNGRDSSRGTIAGGITPSAADAVIDRLNEKYAVILGGGGGILRESIRDDGYPGIDVISAAQFRINEMPLQVLVGQKQVAAADLWLKSQRRREYEGLCFSPSIEAPDGYRNLWTGFAVTPDSSASCQLFIEHVHENVCNGSETLFAWVIGWFAQIIQQPSQKPGTALALTGLQGVGKTLVGQTVGRLLGRHYHLVADQRFLVGRFNSHVIDKLLLQTDEGFWGGDPSVDGKLKDMITGPKHIIEYKGREPITVDNHVRLLVTSNQARVVPAAFDQRRFAVLEVAPHHANDHKYFRAMTDQLDAGGYGGLLHYLQTYDFSDLNLRVPPKTEALLRQKTQSATPEEQWWLDVLEDGRLPGDVGGAIVPCKELYEKYRDELAKRRVQRCVSNETFGHFMRRMVPGLMRTRNTVQRLPDGSPQRQWCYELPSLTQCREAFEAIAGQPVDWPREKDASTLGNEEWAC